MGTFNATFTLTAGSSASVGGFNIVGNPGSVSIATGVSRASLATGVTYNNIADTVTEFTITSTGDCTNSVTVLTAPEPTPTPTSTVYTYDCFEGSCIQVVGTDGQYGTLQLCQGSCSSNPCFIEGTNITLADGSQVLIETLQVGDILKSFAIDTLPLYSDDNTVLSTWNTENLTGTLSTATIMSITPVQISEIVVINDLLKTTPDHRHLVKHDGVWSFVIASNVVVGDIMIDINNNEVEVTSVDTQEVEKTVYKMDVETLDVFYAENILTHNIKNPDTYYCREYQGGPCTAQVGPCEGSQIVCTEFEQPVQA
jgi:hypothetical protein